MPPFDRHRWIMNAANSEFKVAHSKSILPQTMIYVYWYLWQCSDRQRDEIELRWNLFWFSLSQIYCFLSKLILASSISFRFRRWRQFHKIDWRLFKSYWVKAICDQNEFGFWWFEVWYIEKENGFVLKSSQCKSFSIPLSEFVMLHVVWSFPRP